nr:uncharacterized protein CTRU02_05969 [Colletotrichum truncatum]KAF6793097.1 hypothetical protein CTRU02_05969 [Colletotrichum truncatum]
MSSVSATLDSVAPSSPIVFFISVVVCTSILVGAARYFTRLSKSSGILGLQVITKVQEQCLARQRSPCPPGELEVYIEPNGRCHKWSKGQVFKLNKSSTVLSPARN